MWRGEKEARQSSYDCSYCIGKGMKERRVCYRYDKMNPIYVPQIFDEVGNPLFHDKKGKELEGSLAFKWCSREEVIDILVRISSKQSARAAFDIWQAYFRRTFGTSEDGEGRLEICPIGLITGEADMFVRWEGAASKYNSLPFEGSWLDQPYFVHEAFESVQIASAQYERARYLRMKKKMEEQERANKQG